MAGDMIAALGRATVGNCALFGQNITRPKGQFQPLQSIPRGIHAADDVVRTAYLRIPQARQTWSVLGSQPKGGWGFDCGVNEHQVAGGTVSLRQAWPREKPALLGSELVRLMLERSKSALQGVDIVTQLVQQYGLGAALDDAAGATDHTFLIVDPLEAYVIETAGPHWVCQEIREVRAASNVRVIRQDWSRISSGLASQAIQKGWWPEDGSKIDFAGALGEDLASSAAAMRRWGRATLFLQEQNGHIDLSFFQRILSDHNDDVEFPDEARLGTASICQHARTADGPATATSFLARLSHDENSIPVVWCTFGLPCAGLYFPILLDGELPEPFTRTGLESLRWSFWWALDRLQYQFLNDPACWDTVREPFARLHCTFEDQVEEFVQEAAGLRKRRADTELSRQATLFMEYCLERFEETATAVLQSRAVQVLEA